MEKLHKFLIQPNKSPPSYLSIGQYGFLESSHFHPQSGNASMGLHFLEKGIFIRKRIKPKTLLDLQSKPLCQMLFGKENATKEIIATYQEKRELFLAYLLSPIGGAIYLHALLSYKKNETKDIDLCTPDLKWLIEFVEMQSKNNKPLIEGSFNIQRLEIHFQGHIHTKTFAESGKVVRILCPGTLPNEDFITLICNSHEFVAVRGDQSFSEVVSCEKLFFYDGASHARYFMKDLIALAENRLRKDVDSLEYFRSMQQAYLHNLPEETTEWVEDTYFQETKPWQQIAETIALLLQKPHTAAGCKKLCTIIRNEYSFNETLCLMIQKAFAHQV